MMKLLANAAVAMSLVMGLSLEAPAWSAGTEKSSANCPKAKAKAAKAKRTTAPQPARSVTLVDKRKLDVQILSFGP